MHPGLLRDLYPIRKLTIYPGGVGVVSRSGGRNVSRETIAGQTGRRITRLSRKSLHRLAYTATVASSKFRSVMCLTFSDPFPISGRVVKYIFNSFRIRMNREFGRMDYLWFLEFQPTRKAPHLHMFCSLPAPTKAEKSFFAWAWARCLHWDASQSSGGLPTGEMRSRVQWFHRTKEETWEALRSPDGCARYAAKYALKPEQKAVPPEFRDVGRFWGTSRGLTDDIEPLDEIEITEDELREALWALDHPTKKWDVLPKYIFGVDKS